MFGLKTGQVGKLGGIGGGGAKRPAISMDFSDDTVFDPRVTFSRTGIGTYYDKTGVLRAANSNVPRIDYGPVPSGVTNWVNSSTNAGAVIGTPGSRPPGWFPASASGITTQVVGVGTINDIPYVDMRVFGVATSAGQLKLNLSLMSALSAAAIFGQQWTGSVYVQLLNDSCTVPIVGLQLTLAQSGTAATSYLNGPSITLASAATFQRQTFSTTTNSATITSIQLSVWSTGATSVINDTIDITIRVGAPQLEKSAVANPWVPTTGGVATVGATALGLLIEEGRTNLWLQSADANNAAWNKLGTTSAPPTTTANQASAPDGTVTAAKVDYPLVALGGSVSVLYQGVTATAVPYTFSVWLKGAVGGEKIYLSANIGGAPFYSTLATVTTAWQRYTFTTPALTAATWFFVIGTDTRDAAQLATPAQTVHMWGAQVELGSFATSYVATTAASATRSGDVASASIIGTWVDGQMTAAATAIFNQGASGSSGIVLFSDGTDNNRAVMRGIGGLVGAAYVVGGVATAQGGNTAIVVGTVYRAVMRMAVNAVSIVANNGTVVTAVGALPVGVITSLAIGRNNTGASLLNGWVKKIVIWKRLLPDAEMVTQSNPAL